MIALTFEAMGYRDVMGRFAKRSERLASGQREVARDSGRLLIETLIFKAPYKTGKFAQGFAYRTDETGQGTRVTVYVKGEHAFLLPFITEGTRPHEIPIGGSAAQMAKGYPLHWLDESGRDRFAWSVWHPGTAPNPFVQDSLDAVRPLMRDELQLMCREVAFL